MKKNKILISAIALFMVMLGGYQITTANFNQNTSINPKISAGALGIEIVDFDTQVQTKQNGQYTFSSAMPGTKMSRSLGIKNSKDKDLYVRVTLTRYWKDEQDKKVVDANPSYIDVVTNQENQWLIKEETGSNQERIVFYFLQPLGKGQQTSAFMDAIKITDQITDQVYSTYHANVEVEAEAIQQAGAKDAMLAQWGVEVEMDQKGNIISIVE